MRMLRERGYEPVDEDAETVRLLNCPFHGVAQRFPDLVCGVNIELLRGVLEGLETDGLQATLDPREGTCCVAIKVADA
jgi:predicted ArsR family transcriptional regulator